MRLFVFPEAPVPDNGFGIAVADAYRRLAPTDDDIVVWYSTKKTFPQLKDTHHLMMKLPIWSPRRIKNLLINRPSHELSPSTFSFLRKYDFEEIHCDDTTFFFTLRKLFPDKHINVRFHNSYARIEDRRRLLHIPLGLKFRLVLKAYYQLERMIFNDRNSTKIFLTAEDQNYYCSHFGIYSDSYVWPGMEYEKLNALKTRCQMSKVDRLVWFGGIESHKESSVRWFADIVFPQLKQRFPELTFHLYGSGTQKFDNQAVGIFGHGFYDGEGTPDKGRSLFVNPDIIGSGIKLKLLTYMQAGVPFITTPFGFEGYPKELADDFCIVSEKEHWVDDITSFITKSNS